MALNLALDVPASYFGRSWSPSCLNWSGFTVTLNAREKHTHLAPGRFRLRLCLDLACANLGLLFPRMTACDGDGLRPHCTNDNWGYLRCPFGHAPRLRLPSTKSLVVGCQAFSAKPNANRHQSAPFTPDRCTPLSFIVAN